MKFKELISNKSLMSNLIAFLIIIISYMIPKDIPWHSTLKNVGFFAISGGLTNWIAIHMLFEKVPGFYGSGIIQNKFQEFKIAIKNIIMDQFLTKDKLTLFFNAKNGLLLNIETMTKEIDYKSLFEQLIETIKETPLGSMLSFISSDILESLEKKFTEKMEFSLQKIFHESEIGQKVDELMDNLNPDKIHTLIQELVSERLEELTPKTVKEIIQDMIRSHLGWLVIWGAVFGGFIGLIADLLSL